RVPEPAVVPPVDGPRVLAAFGSNPLGSSIRTGPITPRRSTLHNHKSRPLICSAPAMSGGVLPRGSDAAGLGHAIGCAVDVVGEDVEVEARRVVAAGIPCEVASGDSPLPARSSLSE